MLLPVAVSTRTSEIMKIALKCGRLYASAVCSGWIWHYTGLSKLGWLELSCMPVKNTNNPMHPCQQNFQIFLPLRPQVTVIVTLFTMHSRVSLCTSEDYFSVFITLPHSIKYKHQSQNTSQLKRNYGVWKPYGSTFMWTITSISIQASRKDVIKTCQVITGSKTRRGSLHLAFW
jgi:hypothetical protein